VSRVVWSCRSLVRRAVRAYHLACARDDAASHGVVVATGLWICRGCEAILLEAEAVSEHMRTAAHEVI
jgi:hypothetical protein